MSMTTDLYVINNLNVNGIVGKRIYGKQIFLENVIGTEIKLTLPNNYILEEDVKLEFINYVYLDFPLYLRGTRIENNSKVFIKVNVLYKFIKFSPDVNFEILEDDVIIYSENIGVSIFSDRYNKLLDEVLLDIGNIENIRFRLSKTDLRSQEIYLKHNSIIILESL